MTKEQKKKIAENVSINALCDWQTKALRFMDEVNDPLIKAERAVCRDCPLRTRPETGGCLGEECPIHKVRDALLKVRPRMNRLINKTIR